MTKPQLIELIKLLSALESCSFATKHVIPDYLLEGLCLQIDLLTNEVLK